MILTKITTFLLAGATTALDTARAIRDFFMVISTIPLVFGQKLLWTTHPRVLNPPLVNLSRLLRVSHNHSRSRLTIPQTWQGERSVMEDYGRFKRGEGFRLE
jgi:hypothetical protein